MSKWEEWKKSHAKPWHILDPDRHVSSNEIAEQRLKICESCEFYKITKQCSKCGCIMPIKVQLALAECPVGKWSQEDSV